MDYTHFSLIDMTIVQTLPEQPSRPAMSLFQTENRIGG